MSKTPVGKIWDRFASSYARQPIADEDSYRKKLQLTREYLTRDINILEIGCGTGGTAIAHAPYVNHIRAIDCSEKMLEFAVQKALQAQVTNVDFELGDLSRFDFGDQSEDVVLALSVLHLIENRVDVIRRIYACLNPGGVFISSTACLGDQQRWYHLLLNIAGKLRVVPPVEFFTQTQLLGDLREARFDIEYSWSPGKHKALFVVAKKGS